MSQQQPESAPPESTPHNDAVAETAPPEPAPPPSDAPEGAAAETGPPLGNPMYRGGYEHCEELVKRYELPEREFGMVQKLLPTHICERCGYHSTYHLDGPQYWFTAVEASEYLRVDYLVVLRLLADGTLIGGQVPGAKQIRFSRDELDQVLIKPGREAIKSTVDWLDPVFAQFWDNELDDKYDEEDV